MGAAPWWQDWELRFCGVLGGEWGAAPWWWDSELQLCWGPGVGYSGVMPPGGRIGNCGSVGYWVENGAAAPWWSGLGIAVMLGSRLGNGGAAPWWWDWELQLCPGPGMGVLPPAGGIGNCSCAGVPGWVIVG